MFEWEPIPHQIQWSEGMLLSPQHFQQDQIYLERLLRHQMEQVLPHYWGILNLEVDESALLSGHLKLVFLQAVMPDGLVIEYSMERDQVLELDIKSALDKLKGKTHKVYLCVPQRRPGAASANASIRRFDSHKKPPIVDDNTGDGEISMEELSPRLILMVGPKPSAQYIWIPLLEIYRDEDGAFKVANYVPPLLRVTKKPFLTIDSLGRRLDDLTRAIREKVLGLAKISSDEKGMDASVSLEHRRTIFQFVASLPELEVLINGERAHPFAIYQALARMVGQVSALSFNPIPEPLPPYDHNNVGPGMTQALSMIHQILNQISLAYTVTPFAEEKTGYFSLELPKQWPHPTLLLELQGPDSQTTQDFENWVSGCRIASVSVFNKLTKQRMPGAIPKFLPKHDGMGVVSGPGRALFEVAISEETIQLGKKLYIVNTRSRNSDLGPTSILLYIPNSQKPE